MGLYQKVNLLAQFVSQNGENFVFIDLLQKSVEQDNALVVEEAKHERIGMRRPLGAIHDKKFGKRKLERARELINALLETPIFQGFIFVEERHDENRNLSQQEDSVSRRKVGLFHRRKINLQ